MARLSAQAQSGKEEAPLARFALVRQCPLCQRAYRFKQMTIIESWDTNQFVHVRCDGCQVAMLLLLVSTPLGMSSIGMLTDLSADDVKHFRTAEPISEEDLFSFHESIQKRNIFDQLVSSFS